LGYNKKDITLSYQLQDLSFETMQLSQLIVPGNDPEGKPTAINLPGPDGLNFDSIGDIITKLLPIVLSLAGIILFIYLLIGGFSYLFSAGDSAQMDKARQQITNALIGFVIIFLSYFLTQLLCFVFGCTIV
jgi:hypothetical protein